MSEAKTAIKKGGVKAGSDVLPRYLAGSTYSTHAMRRGSPGGGSKKKLGKKKVQVIRTPFTEGCDHKGWVL